MSDEQKFIFYVIAIGVFCFSIFKATASDAMELALVNDVRLDLATVTRGYNVPSGDENFNISIAARQFTAPVSVKIEELLDEKETSLPDELAAETDNYIYDIKTTYKGILKSPVKLVFDYTGTINEKSAVYYYDKGKVKWIALPTVIDINNHRVISKTPFPYAEVVVAGPAEKKVIEQINDTVVADDGFTAHGAIAVDEDGQVIFEKNPDKVWPLASLTKLMTAYVFLQHQPDWNKKIKIEKSDIVGGASVYYQVGDLVTVKDLFYSMLIGSKNDSTMAIMRATGLTNKQFIAEMNQIAKDWELTNTKFYEPTGLDARNVSTAREFIVVAQKVYAYPEMAKAMEYDYYPMKYERKGVSWKANIKNTNLTIIQKDLYVLGSKTGWTEEADHNLVTKAKKTKNDEHAYIALVLGSRVWKNYDEVYTMLQKGFDLKQTVALK